MQSLQKSLAGLRADGATGLYDTVIAGRGGPECLARGQQHHRPDQRRQERGPRERLARAGAGQARALAGTEPVRILSIALGGEADAVTLRRLADAAKGEAYVAREAQDLGKVFLAALTD